jgi:hypothetical protein
MRDNATDTYLPHITGFYCYFKRQKNALASIWLSFMAMSVHTKWKVIENSQLPVLFFNNPHTEGTKNTTDYVAHKYEAKYVTIIND